MYIYIYIYVHTYIHTYKYVYIYIYYLLPKASPARTPRECRVYSLPTHALRSSPELYPVSPHTLRSPELPDFKFI